MHLFASSEEQLVGVNTEQSFLSVLELAQQESWPPDLIFLTGDLSQDASEESYSRLIKHLTALNIPCYVLPGNHDIPDTITDIFSQQPVTYQPFLHHGNWLFAFLDSETPNEEGGTLDEAAIKELQLEVDSNSNKHILICLHHQLKPVGSRWLDTMAVANPSSLINIIKNSPNVRGVIHGHVHQTYESDIAGVPIYAVPSTCFQFKPLCNDFAVDNIAPGYRWLRLQANGNIQTDVVRLDKAPENLDQNSAGY
ncbi:MAG: calcineurin [Cycloclasticus sp. symbiont of Bathymodiolus heckerae]|nr:MAG: calcineurin [Cycloclasticus sp. symbiont of Bathymodiolus heckerae]